MNQAAIKLRKICERVVADPALAPEKDANGTITKTKCNLAVQIVCEEMGYGDFLGMVANDIYALVKKSKDWKRMSGEDASEAANEGKLAIAAVQGKPHGHVAILFPGPEIWSGHWNREAPSLANVGIRNGVMGASWAFAKEPEWFVLVRPLDLA